MPTLNTKFKKKPSRRKWLSFIINSEKKGSERYWELDNVGDVFLCSTYLVFDGDKKKQNQTQHPIISRKFTTNKGQVGAFDI